MIALNSDAYADAEIRGLRLKDDDSPIVDLHFGEFNEKGEREGMAMNMPLDIVFVDGKPANDINGLALGQKCAVLVTPVEPAGESGNWLWTKVGGCRTVMEKAKLREKP